MIQESISFYLKMKEIAWFIVIFHFLVVFMVFFSAIFNSFIYWLDYRFMSFYFPWLFLWLHDGNNLDVPIGFM